VPRPRASPRSLAVVARGAVYTRPEVADAVLDLAGWTTVRPLHRLRLLEPSCGAGDFLRPAISRLLAAYLADGGTLSKIVRTLRPAIRAVEVDAASHAATRDLVLADLRARGVPLRAARALCEAWLVRADFLLTDDLDGKFDVVVGNPPYVRQERISTDLLTKYRRRYATIYDRADLYIPFFERGLQLLADGGRLAFICADRWLKNRYGGPLRGLIAREFSLTHYIDLAGADAFQADVHAYAAITVLQRGSHPVTRIARRPDLTPASLRPLVAALLGDGSDPRVEEVEPAARSSAPWLLDPADHTRLLRRLERDFPELADAGCTVGIGVASGADDVFINDLERLPVEPARKLPLVMADDLHAGELRWRGRGIINPFEPDGSLAELARYPQFAAHVARHRRVLAARHVARRTGAWYRTIDRIYPELVRAEKLLIPDIRGESVVVHDPGHYYPHHNLYHVTAATWELPALATVLRSSIATLFVAAYCVKMSGGFLRFQAQYLRRIRVPRWDGVTPDVRAALRAADPTDLDAIDRATFAAYGLDEGEAAVVRRIAAAARVPRRRG
jgi:hypothetical protein